MDIADPTWSNVTGDVELSVRLCCGIEGNCGFSVWDLESLEIWNLQGNTLSLSPGAEDV